MDFIGTFLIWTFISWVTLLVVIPIAQRLADFAMPPLGQLLWTLAVVAAVTNAVTLGLTLVNPFLGWLAGIIVFFVFMVKWFQIDFFGGVIIVVVSWVVSALQ
jgi:hypothetical protein